MKIINWLRFQRAWIKWAWKLPGYRFGDPNLDRPSKRILSRRHAAKEPRREEYGL